MTRLAEFEFIARHLRPLATHPGALDLGDDAALIDGPLGSQWVIAKDAIVENVHFRSDDPPASIAAKLLGTNLSDLAAMGAEPAFYLSVLARPPAMTDDWLIEFTRGLGEVQRRFGLALLGGDTVSTQGPIVLSCTIIGQVPEGQALRRSGARPGDLVCVSGTLGDAALGLRVLNGLAATDDDRIYLSQRYQIPQPRVALGMALRQLATACIDVSDGLAADLGHLLERSHVGATIQLVDLPLSEIGRQLPGAAQAALCGGDDYELVFTLPEAAQGQLASLASRAEVPITIIGRITAEPGLRVLDANSRAVIVERTGWQHG